MNKNIKCKLDEYPIKNGIPKFYFAAIFSCIGSLGIGTAVGYSSPAIPSMEEPDSGFEPLTENQKTWVASIVAIGALFGGLAGGPIIERFGRKTLLIASGIPFAVGWLIVAFSGTFYPVIIGRLLKGFCCGLVCLTTPVYISETAPAHLRGFLGTFLGVAIFVGVLLAYVLGMALNWFWLAIVLTIIPLTCSVFMLFMPESPRWLIKRGQRSKAISAIIFLNGNTVDPEVECREMETNAMDQPTGRITLKEALKPSVIKPIGLTLTVMLCQQWTGFNGVLFFAGSIFKDSGYTSISPAMSSIILALGELGGNLASTFIIDRAGRKVLLLASAIFMAISLTILSILSYMVESEGSWVTERFGWLTVVSLCVYVTAFSLGFGPIPWVIMGELLPVRFRGIGSSVVTAFCWGNGFLVGKTFMNLRSGLTVCGAYLFYDVVCVLSCVFVAIFLPETKGKSLEEIERYFGEKSLRVKSTEDEEKL